MSDALRQQFERHGVAVASLVEKFSMAMRFQDDLENGILSAELKMKFAENGISLSDQVMIATIAEDREWKIDDVDNERTYLVVVEDTPDDGWRLAVQERMTSAQVSITKIGNDWRVDVDDQAYIVKKEAVEGEDKLRIYKQFSYDIETGGFAPAQATYEIGDVQAQGSVAITNTSRSIESESGSTHVAGRNISLAAQGGHVGTSSQPLRTDLTAGSMDVSALDDLFVTEIQGDMAVGLVDSVRGDVSLEAARGGILKSGAFAGINGRNISLTALRGGIGKSAEPLDIDSSHESAGMVNAVARDGVFISETKGDLNVDAIASRESDVPLATASGSVLDAADDETADIQGAHVDLLVAGGGIGTVDNDFEIYGVGAGQSENARQIDPAVPAVGRLVARSEGSVYVAEVDAALRVLEVTSQLGEIRLTVSDSAGADDDLSLVPGGQTLSGVPITSGLISAPQSVTVMAGDDVIVPENTLITSASSVLVSGDAPAADSDPGRGTTVDVRGDVRAPSVEIVGGLDDDRLQGGSGDDSLYGGSGNDVLDGGAGNDDLFGELGNDLLRSRQGDDSLSGGRGDDTFQLQGLSHKDLHDDEGLDTLDFSQIERQAAGPLGGVTVDLSIDNGAVQTILDQGTLSLNGDFENLIGTAYANRLTGNPLDNVIFGGGGRDQIHGQAGNDTLNGGAGDDELFGDSGDDHLISNWDDDSLSGGPGDDRFELRGFGNQRLDDDQGVDTLDYSQIKRRGAGRFGGVTVDLSINDGTSQFVRRRRYMLSLSGDFENLIGTAYADRLMGNALDNVIAGQGGQDRLYGRAGNDTLYGGAGNDRLHGASGDDQLFGNSGLVVALWQRGL